MSLEALYKHDRGAWSWRVRYFLQQVSHTKKTQHCHRYQYSKQGSVLNLIRRRFCERCGCPAFPIRMELAVCWWQGMQGPSQTCHLQSWGLISPFRILWPMGWVGRRGLYPCCLSCLSVLACLACLPFLASLAFLPFLACPCHEHCWPQPEGAHQPRCPATLSWVVHSSPCEAEGYRIGRGLVQAVL